MQVSSFLVLDMVIHIWHQLPLIGRLAGPVTQFLNMLECMSMPQAVVLAALGFVGPLRWWTFQFVRLWRTSRVTALITCPALRLQAAGCCSKNIACRRLWQCEAIRGASVFAGRPRPRKQLQKQHLFRCIG